MSLNINEELLLISRITLASLIKALLYVVKIATDWYLFIASITASMLSESKWSKG